MMYAIAFDLDQTILSQTYGNPSYTNAYNDIKRVLRDLGFVARQGSVYFGDDTDAVKCVLAAQTLARTFAWFTPSIRDIRMLRIEDNNDLKPAIKHIQVRVRVKRKRHR